ncbi:hypothetical protein AAH979_03805 [Plantactinospora sp. ZYX-F-223]|uniref:hypothetical protein n=1 Tax=Plantactinospora sp. ZYX-F-223 TaxID=3144103 RepID=UPI0031FDB30B
MSEIDHHLRRQVNEVQHAVAALDHTLGLVNQQVYDIGNKQQESHDKLLELRDEFRRHVARTERIANLQRAETRVGALQGELEHQFGHHKVVRRTAVGMLQAFDVGLVSEETVREVGEQLMVQTPRYWLAPVLVALAAWAGDDQDLCGRAIEEAFRRSPDRTSLFMALVLRRQGRRASSVRWLRHYLAAQDPAALGRDFAVILEAISHGAFGPAGLELVRDFLDRCRRQLLSDESMQRAQVDRWRHELESLVGTVPAAARFPRLAEVSPQWPQMDTALVRAESHRSVVDKYTAMLAEEIVPNDRLEDAVDDILDRLVAEYDTEELPLRRELARSQAVIAHDGDLEAATRTVDAGSAALESTLDYLTIQTTAALDPAAIGVSRSTQRIAVSACHEWLGTAHAEFTRDYRLVVPSDVEAAFEGTHNPGAQAFQLPRWTGSFTRPLEDLERSLVDHWDRHGKPYIDGFAFNWGKALVLPIAVLSAVLLVFGVCGSIGFGLLAAVLGGGIWALVLYSQSQAAQRRQSEAAELIARARQDSLAQLRGAHAELTDWTSQFKAADGTEAQVRTLIAELASAGQTVSPYERRTVAAAEQGHRADRSMA